jgi:hypothetical protein
LTGQRQLAHTMDVRKLAPVLIALSDLLKAAK